MRRIRPGSHRTAPLKRTIKKRHTHELQMDIRGGAARRGGRRDSAGAGDGHTPRSRQAVAEPRHLLGGRGATLLQTATDRPARPLPDGRDARGGRPAQ